MGMPGADKVEINYKASKRILEGLTKEAGELEKKIVTLTQEATQRESETNVPPKIKEYRTTLAALKKRRQDQKTVWFGTNVSDVYMKADKNDPQRKVLEKLHEELVKLDKGLREEDNGMEKKLKTKIEGAESALKAAKKIPGQMRDKGTGGGLMVADVIPDLDKNEKVLDEALPKLTKLVTEYPAVEKKLQAILANPDPDAQKAKKTLEQYTNLVAGLQSARRALKEKWSSKELAKFFDTHKSNSFAKSFAKKFAKLVQLDTPLRAEGGGKEKVFQDLLSQIKVKIKA